MSDLVKSLLANQERRLSEESFVKIAGWVDGLREFGGANLAAPSRIFQRFHSQAAGVAIQNQSTEHVRLLVKAHLQGAGWVHDPLKERDWVALTMPLFVSRQLGVDALEIFRSAASDYGKETEQMIVDFFPDVAQELDRNGGPVNNSGVSYVAVQLLGGIVDFEPVWNYDFHDDEIRRAENLISMLEGGARATRRERGPKAAVELVNSVTSPETTAMSWFSNKPAPAGFVTWGDADPIEKYRRDLDDVAAIGGDLTFRSADVIDAYVREKATDVARVGSEEKLKQGAAVAAHAGPEALRLLGHALWTYEGVQGADRFDKCISELPDSNTTESAIPPGRELVRDHELEGIVFTGLYTGMKYSRPLNAR